MTFTDMYASIKTLYKSMMFPTNKDAPRMSMNEIDQMDAFFFSELMNHEREEPQEKERYLSEVW